VRSSWLASAAKRRKRSSVACWSAKLDSRRPSMPLIVEPSLPSSVRSDGCSTRCPRSAASVIDAAERSIRRSGRNPSPTTSQAISSTTTMLIALVIQTIFTTLFVVASTSDVGSATTSRPGRSLTRASERSRIVISYTVTRHLAGSSPPTDGTVNGSP
jgi:hypothetical protein